MFRNNNLEQQAEEHWEEEVEARQMVSGYQDIWRRLWKTKCNNSEPSYPYPEPEDCQEIDDEELWTGTEK